MTEQECLQTGAYAEAVIHDGKFSSVFERRQIAILPLLLSYFDSFILTSAPAVQTVRPGTTFPLLCSLSRSFPLPFAVQYTDIWTTLTFSS